MEIFFWLPDLKRNAEADLWNQKKTGQSLGKWKIRKIR
jgi:hypothetical protein